MYITSVKAPNTDQTNPSRRPETSPTRWSSPKIRTGGMCHGVARIGNTHQTPARPLSPSFFFFLFFFSTQRRNRTWKRLTDQVFPPPSLTVLSVLSSLPLFPPSHPSSSSWLLSALTRNSLISAGKDLPTPPTAGTPLRWEDHASETLERLTLIFAFRFVGIPRPPAPLVPLEMIWYGFLWSLRSLGLDGRSMLSAALPYRGAETRPPKSKIVGSLGL